MGDVKEKLKELNDMYAEGLIDTPEKATHRRAVLSAAYGNGGQSTAAAPSGLSLPSTQCAAMLTPTVTSDPPRGKQKMEYMEVSAT